VHANKNIPIDNKYHYSYGKALFVLSKGKKEKIVFKPVKAKFLQICAGKKFINFWLKCIIILNGKTPTVGTVQQRQRWSILLEYNFCFFICTNYIP
jgi:hypothetical protein